MIIAHLSDLHLGKRVKEHSMLDNQEFILDEIIKILTTEKVETVIIAGDVYDKSVPPAEAVTLFDAFITKLANLKLNVLIISGNHDSAERVSFGANIMKHQGIYLSRVFDINNQQIEKVTLTDQFGNINFYLMPFIKPANVRAAMPHLADQVTDYTSAMRVIVNSLNINTNERNIMVAHQFITGAERSDSEEVVVGGLDNVDCSVFSNFNYVALGHLHKPQNITDNIRYCGSPLKYSIAEANHKKSVTIINITNNNQTVSEVPLTPKQDWQDLRGTFAELNNRNNGINNNFVRITLTDPNEQLNAFAILHDIFPNIIEFGYANSQNSQTEINISNVQRKQPIELFAELFESANNRKMDDCQTEYLNKLIDEIFNNQKQ